MILGIIFISIVILFFIILFTLYTDPYAEDIKKYERIEELMKEVFPINTPVLCKIRIESVHENHMFLPKGIQSLVDNHISKVYIVRKPRNIVVAYTNKDDLKKDNEIQIITSASERKNWFIILSEYFNIH